MEKEPHYNSDPEIKKLGDLIKHVKVAMLTTRTTDEKLHSAPLLTPELTFDGELWFLISKSSQKTTDIRSDRRVNISYASSMGKYVSISGIAELMDDSDMVRELWNKSYQEWFPQGVTDPNIQLLKVHIEAAEYWDAHASPMSRILEFAHLAKSHPAKKGEHGTLGVKH